jgi:7-keto-8-aminopelargonate synthetase-like enzyme
VPVNTARLRLSLSALHQPEDVQCLVAALQNLQPALSPSSSLGAG